MARVLIVDDDVRLCQALRLLLESDHHEVITTNDGATALRLARQTSVDVFICDVFMPEQDGLETIQQFRSDFPAVPIVAMSGGGCGSLMNMLPVAKLLGANRILHKPFGRAALVSLLADVLGQKPAGERQA